MRQCVGDVARMACQQDGLLGWLGVVVVLTCCCQVVGRQAVTVGLLTGRAAVMVL